jgi:Glycosyltransferase sugar-binding region containing DXD motif
LSDSALPVVQYWHCERVPELVVESMATFEACNPGRRHVVFHETSAERFIAEHFTDREVAAFRACAVPAMQADYFRYCAIHALGGLYSDVGWRCVSDLQPLLPTPSRGKLFLAPAGNIINGVFAFGSPGHLLLELTLEVATANIERRISDRVYFTTGVPILIFLLELPRFGSFDAMIARSAGTRLQPLVRAYCEVIGDFARVEPALEGVERVEPDRYRPFIRPAERLAASARGTVHWSEVEGGIFR